VGNIKIRMASNIEKFLQGALCKKEENIKEEIIYK
jgi:hypothetical protein